MRKNSGPWRSRETPPIETLLNFHFCNSLRNCESELSSVRSCASALVQRSPQPECSTSLARIAARSSNLFPLPMAWTPPAMILPRVTSLSLPSPGASTSFTRIRPITSLLSPSSLLKWAPRRAKGGHRTLPPSSSGHRNLSRPSLRSLNRVVPAAHKREGLLVPDAADGNASDGRWVSAGARHC